MSVFCKYVMYVFAGVVCVTAFGEAEVWGMDTITVSHECGEVEPGKLYTKTLLVRNTFGDRFEVGRIMQSCNCTEVKLSQNVIEPGSTIDATVKLKAPAEGFGKREFSIVLMEKRDAQKRIMLRISMTTPPDPRLLADPHEVDCGNVASKPSVRVIRITRADRSAIAVEGIECSSDSLDARELERSNSNNSVYVEVRAVNGALNVGRFEEYIKIRTKHPTHKDIKVPVCGEVLGAVYSKPRRLFVGRVGAKTVLHRIEVVSECGDSVDLKSTEEDLGPQWESHIDGGVVELCYTPGAPTSKGGVLRGTVKILGVVNGKEEVVRVPVYGYNGQKGLGGSEASVAAAPSENEEKGAEDCIDRSSHAFTMNVDIDRLHYLDRVSLNIVSARAGQAGVVYTALLNGSEKRSIELDPGQYLATVRWNGQGAAGRAWDALLYVPFEMGIAENRCSDIVIKSGSCSIDGTVPLVKTPNGPYAVGEDIAIYRIFIVQESAEGMQVFHRHLQRDPAVRNKVKFEGLPSGKLRVIGIGRTGADGYVLANHQSITLLEGQETKFAFEPPKVGTATLYGAVPMDMRHGRGPVAVMVRKQGSDAVGWSNMTELGVADAIAVTTDVTPDGTFIFRNLPSGVYTVTMAQFSDGSADIYGRPQRQVSQDVRVEAESRCRVVPTEN